MSDDAPTFGTPAEEDVAGLEPRRGPLSIIEGLLADGYDHGSAITYGEMILTRTHSERNLWRCYYDGEHVETFNVARPPTASAFHAALHEYHRRLTAADGDTDDAPEHVDVRGMYR